MLTLSTIPKPFERDEATIQRNAITSWTLLTPACEVVLFGDEGDAGEGRANREAEIPFYRKLREASR